MRMNVRCSGSVYAARPATRHLSSSLLPEPVVPPIRPCGPSRTRSSVKTPLSVTPSGTSPPGSLPAWRQRRRIASPSMRSSSSSPSMPTLAGRPASAWRSSGSWKRARSRAQPAAVSVVMPASSTSIVSRPSSGRCSVASPVAAATWMTVLQAEGRRSADVATTIPATGTVSSRRPAGGRLPCRRRSAPASSRSRAGAFAPSVRTSESSTASTVPVAAPPLARRRSIASLCSRASDSQRWSPPELSCVCGSHLHQSQSGARPGSTKTATVTSAGPWVTAAWQSRLRAVASATSRSPTMPTTPPRARSTGAGTARSLPLMPSLAPVGSLPGSFTGGSQGRSVTPA